MHTAGFHGSYSPTDVTFLLRRMQLDNTSVEAKERLIQTGQRHYSEMLTIESPPSPEHLALYQQALADGLARLATEVQTLAVALQQRRPHRPIILVSFVRAGVPLGVLLVRALRDLGVESTHYGISIIRDKGIDHAALADIEQQHGFDNLVFIDGWVGKGAIHQQLTASLGSRYPDEIPFVTLADPTGKAWLAASSEDWLIPFGILGATVSGLVSRSVLPSDAGWHGCMHYEHLQAHDVSNAFVTTVDQYRRQNVATQPIAPLQWSTTTRNALKQTAAATICHLAETHNIQNLNRIKPGIAEATRAVMRRVPEHILVQDVDDPNIRLLRYLATSRGIRLQAVGNQLTPYRAITIIQKAV